MSVWRYHGDRQSTVFEEDSVGEVGVPGDSGFWDSLLDVFYPANRHWEVTNLYLLFINIIDSSLSTADNILL